uniref:Uncharacterized protein n=2 Tax=Clytia hemisphaerica TaxID=252671 RepID=A0A7M5XI78_9CNID
MSSSEIDDPNDSDFIPDSEDEEESEENCIPPTPAKRKRKIKESQIQESSKDKVTKKKTKYNTLPNDLKQKVANDYDNNISKLQDLVEKDENTDYIAIFTLVMELGSLELDYSFLLSK